MKGWRWIGGGIFALLFCCISWGAAYCNVSAAGANVSIETDANPVVKGEVFYVMITVTSTEEIGGFEGYFSYNQGVMKYMTGGNVSSGNDDVFSVSDVEREEGATTLKYSVQFKARRAGSSTVELKSPYNVYNSDCSEKMSVAYDSLNIRVLSKKEARRLQEAADPTENPPEETDQEQTVTGEGVPTDKPETEEEEQQESPRETGRQDDFSGVAEKETAVEKNPPDESGEALQTVPPRQTDAVESDEAVSSRRGLSRQICIAVIVIASINLILLGIAFFRIKRKNVWMEEREPDEETIASRVQESMEYPEDMGALEDSDQWEKTDDTEESYSMEQIERRLEQKRRWLRKDDN